MKKAKEGSSSPPPEKITKLEGAERLLKTSIHLFFDERDMLAIQALVAGAHEVLRTLLAKKKQIGSFIKDNDHIRPEYLREYLNHLNRTQNFLKHADKDPDGILDFYEAATPFWILDAIGMYVRLTGSMKHEVFFIFFGWFAQEYPKVLNEGPLLNAVNQFNPSWEKKDYLDLIENPGLLGSKGVPKDLI